MVFCHRLATHNGCYGGGSLNRILHRQQPIVVIPAVHIIVIIVAVNGTQGNAAGQRGGYLAELLLLQRGGRGRRSRVGGAHNRLRVTEGQRLNLSLVRLHNGTNRQPVLARHNGGGLGSGSSSSGLQLLYHLWRCRCRRRLLYQYGQPIHVLLWRELGLLVIHRVHEQLLRRLIAVAALQLPLINASLLVLTLLPILSRVLDHHMVLTSQTDL